MQIADQVLFKGYSGNPQGYEALLAPGDACVVEEVDGDTAVVVRTLTSAGRMSVREWVFPEELMRIDPSKPDETARAQRVFRMMANENTKDFTDLRDRVAYMFVTGAHPTNLRPFFTNALNVVSTWAGRARHFGPRVIDRPAVYMLRLREHPLVVEAQRLMSEGWRLAASLGPNKRRPFGNLYFLRDQDRLTLHAEGWTRPGWPQDWPKRSTRRLN
jgi:hypothetical protein